MVEPRRRARLLPIWLSAALITLALAITAYVVYWFVTSGPAASEVVVLDRGPQDGVQTIVADRSWRVQSGNNGLKLTRDADGQFQADVYLVQYDFLTPEQFDALKDGRRIAADPALADDLALTTPQRDELRRQVKRGFNLDVPARDRARLIELFQDYLAAAPAAKDAREHDLLVALDDVGDRLTADARRATADAAARIRGLLTPAQWTRFQQM